MVRFIFLSILIFAVPSFAVTHLFGVPVVKSVTSTSAVMLAANSLRTYLIICNTGSTTAYVKFGSAQTGYEGIPILAGGNYEPQEAPANSVYAATSTSTTSLTIVEGN